MTKLHVSSTPHIHEKGASTRNIMLDVIIALLPATVVGCILFGLRALLVILTCVASSVLAELVFNLCARKKQTVGDFSAVVTGLLLGLNLSTNVTIWQCVVGSVFAIVIVKCAFGGLGKNFANPAITARVFLLIAFSGTVAGGAAPIKAELTSSATPLVTLNQGAEAAKSISLMELFIGNHAGAIGETCAIALLVGFIYLVIRKVIKWYVPASYVATVFLCYFLFGGFDATFALQHVLAGGLLLGAIFMSTDYVTTPNTNSGRVIFCVGAGLLTFVIRQYGVYPEGVSLAILFMNLLTPYISSWTKKKTLGGVK